MEKRKQTGGGLHYAWVILAAVIIIRGLAGGGLNMTSALFLAPVAGDIGTGIGELSVYLSITSAVMVLWLPTAGKMIHHFDIRLVAAVGAALQILSFAAMGFADKVYVWYLLAIPYAMGATLLVNLLGPVLINRWFRTNAGTMMGIQMAFVGLFGAVLQPLVSSIIAGRGWRKAYFIVGGITFAAVIIVSSVFLRNRPEEGGLLPYEGVAGKTRKKVNHTGSGERGIGEKEALRSPSFYLLLLFMAAITGVGVFTQHIPTYGSLLGYSVQQTGGVLAAASVGSAIGSIAIGIISDKIGSLKTCYLMIAVGVLAAAGFFLSGGGLLLFYGSAFLHGLVSSGIMVLGPLLTLKFYGQRDYEKIFAKVSMGAPLASIVFVPLYGFVYDMMQSYYPVLIGLLALLGTAAVCITIGYKKRIKS